MILLGAFSVGLVAVGLRALILRRELHPFDVRWMGLLFVAFLPQLFAFVLPTRFEIPDVWASLALVSSQIGLLLFAMANVSKPGFPLLALGLASNLLVILLNGGWMPISPEMVQRVLPQASPDFWQIGARLGTGKDIVLPVEQTRLWVLSDIFLIHYGWNRAAFSPGDVLVALGVIRALWALADRPAPARVSASPVAAQEG